LKEEYLLVQKLFAIFLKNFRIVTKKLYFLNFQLCDSLQNGELVPV